MTKKLVLVLILFLLNNCTIIGFEKGLNYKKDLKYSYKFDKKSQSTTVSSSNNDLDIMFYRNLCGHYALFGPIIPFIPIWENRDCKDIKIAVSKAKNIYIKYNNKIYYPSHVGKWKTYTFPIPIKSIKDNAILVAEKNKEIFEVPFEYKHSFLIASFP